MARESCLYQAVLYHINQDRQLGYCESSHALRAMRYRSYQPLLQDIISCVKEKNRGGGRERTILVG
jgi:hypothetical protein